MALTEWKSCSGSPSSTVRTRPTSRRICVDFRPACSVSSPRIGCRRWAVRRGWPRELPGRGGAESGGGPPERGPPELWRAAMDARDGGQSSVPSKPAPASRPARAAGKRSPGNPGATSGISTASQVRPQPGRERAQAASRKEWERSPGSGMTIRRSTPGACKAVSIPATGLPAKRTASSAKARTQTVSGMAIGGSASQTANVWEGPYVDGEMNGDWVIRTTEGDVGEGPAVDGRWHGRWIIRRENGTVEERLFRDGERIR